MTAPADEQLRAAVANGLERLNRDHGGRHLGRVATALGVHRSSVSRWHAGRAAPSFERCMVLAERYPNYFDRAELSELQARAALGDDHLAFAPPEHPHVATSIAAVYGAAAECLEREPATPAGREVLQTSLHLDIDDTDPVEADPFVTQADRDAFARYKSVMARRAAEGWRIRVVANAGGPGRLDAVERMCAQLDGPDVEIRGYPIAVPLVMSPLVIGRREVFLAYDGLRARRPASALVLRAPTAVAWAVQYFDQIYDEAPHRLRTPRGLVPAAMTAFRRTVEREGSCSIR